MTYYTEITRSADEYLKYDFDLWNKPLGFQFKTSHKEENWKKTLEMWVDFTRMENKNYCYDSFNKIWYTTKGDELSTVLKVEPSLFSYEHKIFPTQLTDENHQIGVKFIAKS
jgi:hypothetical protein